jgi:hypothetical protein
MTKFFYRHKYSIVGFLVATCSPTPIAIARPAAIRCSQAIAQSKAVIPKQQQTVRTGEINPAEDGNPPAGRSQYLNFVFLGNRVKNESSIARKIINNCPKIAVINFIIYGTDDLNSYGLLNNKVQQFQCKDMDTKVIKWGEFRCP